MYDEMAIVVGKDTTRGDFFKSFVDIDADSSSETSKSNDKLITWPSVNNLQKHSLPRTTNFG